jgi:serine/threonine protein phosphatase PrpC
LVDEGHIGEILGAQENPQVASEMLVAAANQAGGHDNMTAIVVSRM